MKNKIIRSILCAALTVGALMTAACSAPEHEHGGEDSRFSLSSLQVIAPVTDAVQKEDIKVPLPKNFTVLRELGYGNEPVVSATGENSDTVDAAVFMRNSKIKEEYGVEITETVTENITADALANFLSGDTSCSMILVSSPSAASLVLSGALKDLGAVTGFSSAASGYSERATKGLALGGRIYLTTGDALVSFMRSCSVLLLNNKVLAETETSASKLFDEVLRGGFTYDKMLQLASSASALNGMEGHLSALNIGFEDAFSMFYAGGGRFFSRDSVTYDFVTEKFDAESTNAGVYNGLRQIYGISENGERADSTMSAAPLFTLSSLGEFEALRKSGADFTALPLPKFSESAGGYSCLTDAKRVMFSAIPAQLSEDEAESTVAVMNIIYSSSDGIWKAFSEKCAPDGQGADLLNMIRKSAECDMLAFFGYGDMGEMLSSCIEEGVGANIFEIRATERASAAVAALTITVNKLIK